MSYLTLFDDELERFTRRRRPAAQARVLRMMGVPFVRHPIDGTIIVARSAAARFLGDNALPATASNVVAMVNVEAIRAHGKSAKARGR